MMFGSRYSPANSDATNANTYITNASSLRFGKCIGAGSTSIVSLAMRSTGSFLAVKKLTNFKENNLEILIHSRLNHANIVAYYGFQILTDFSVLLFQEWMPAGSICKVLDNFGPFPEQSIAWYSFQLVSAVQYLHEKKIVHCDIKGENLLVNASGIAKLTDFGASFILDDRQYAHHSEDRQECYCAPFVGTPLFMAPEHLSGGRGSMAGDIWSVGCTMIQMLTGQPPWKEAKCTNINNLYLHIRSWPDVLPALPDDILVSQDLRSCLLICFERSEISRATAKELLEHPFFSQCCSHGDDFAVIPPTDIVDLIHKQHHESRSDVASADMNYSRVFKTSECRFEELEGICTGSVVGTGMAEVSGNIEPNNGSADYLDSSKLKKLAASRASFVRNKCSRDRDMHGHGPIIIDKDATHKSQANTRNPFARSTLLEAKAKGTRSHLASSSDGS